MESKDRSFRGTAYSESDLSEIAEIKLQGFMYSWGKNKDGELGVGHNKNALLPTPIKGLRDKKIVQVSCGGHHTAVVTEDGQLYVCGSSLHGKLGLEDLTFISVNKFHFVTVLRGMKVVQVACGDYHTLSLLDTGVVFAWGGTLHKKLGQKGGRPAQVSGFGDKKVVYVDCGDYHSVALTEKGELYSWGGGGSYFNKGQCGHGTLNDIEAPEMIKFFKGKIVRQVSSGGYHTMALTSEGELYGWGSGSYGECGFGEFVDSSVPRKVTININQKLYQQVLDDIILVDKSITPKILSISCGGHHSMILTDKGLFTCGYASHGQLGLRNTTNQCDPQFVYTISNKKIISIAAGWNHSLALSERLDLYACGYGLFGQLGINSEESKTTFVHIASLRGKNIKDVFAGGNHSWILLDENNPINEEYEPPSPLRSLIATPTKSRDASPDPRAERSLFDNELSIKSGKADRVLQVVFSENEMCHRFVRFVIEEKDYEQFKIKLDDYIKEAYAQDTGLLLHKLQNDADIVEEVNGFGKIISPNISNTSKSFTLMMVADPKRATPPILPNTIPNKNSPSFHTSSTVIGEMQLMKESDILKDENQRALSNWMTMFLEKFGNRLPTIKFFELRPAIYG